MIVEYLSGFGAWNWIILGCVLLALEIVVPGFYLLWIGIAALLTGTISFQLSGYEMWIWQVQVVVFLILSVAAVLVGRWFFAGEVESDQPLLNRRERQLVGTLATLSEPIQNGRGTVRIGDTTWRAEGPDLPAGARVRVVDAVDAVLKVEAA